MMSNPSRELMIQDILNAAQRPSSAGKAGQVSTKTREEMIQDILSASEPPKERSAMDDLAWSGVTSARSAAETFTGGLSEPVWSGMNAVTDMAYRAVAGDDTARNDLSFENLKKSYQDDVALREQKKREFAIADMSGGISGALSPQGIGSKVAATTANAVGKRLSSLGSSTGIQNKVVTGAGNLVKAGAENAASAVASEGMRQAVVESAGFADGASLSDVAETGAQWGAGLRFLPMAYKGGTTAVKYGMSTVLGPKVEVIDKYLKNAERIRQAPSVEAIKDEMDTIAMRLQDDIDKGELSKVEAKQVLRAVQENMKQVRTEATQEFSRQKYDAQKALDRAKQAFDDQVKGQKASLEVQSKVPENIAPEVHGAIFDLKKAVGDGSKAAMEILESAKGTIKYHESWKALEKVKDSLKIHGAPRTGPAKAAHDEIQKLMDMTGGMPSDLDMPSAKRLIQQLDETERAVHGSTEFDSKLGQAIKDFRRGLDGQLKAQVPEYAKAMKDVAANTQLLKKMQSRFGDQHAIIGRLRSIARPEARIDYDDLAALSSATGRGFLSPIDESVKATRTLADKRKLEQMASHFPEHAQMNAAKSRVDRMSHPDAGRTFVDDAVKVSGLLDDEAAHMGRLQDAEQEIAKAQARREPFRTLTPGSSESKINAMMREKDPIETRRMVENLDKTFEKNLAQKIDDRRVLDSFEKGNTNGSRNVNLFAIGGYSLGPGQLVGAGAGTVFGPGVGTALGAATGAVVDKFGPQIARKILDGVIAMKGQPTIQKIQSLNVPPEAKKYLTAQLVRHRAEANSALRVVPKAADSEMDTDSSAPANYREESNAKPLRGKEKWASDGFEKLSQHGDLQSFDRERLMQNAKTKDLLVRASGLRPGSKAMDDVLTRLTKLAGEDKD